MPRGRGSIHALLLAAFFLVVTALTVLGFAVRSWAPEVASEHGKGVDRMIRYLLITTGIIFILGHAVLSWFILRYSRPGGPAAPRLSAKREWLWALIPVLLMSAISEGGVLLIGIPVWAQVYGEPPKDAVRIEVVGKQFEWLVRYPGKDGRFGRTEAALVNDQWNPLGLDEKDPAARDDIVLRGEMHLPVDRPVVVRIRSHDVLHSFTIPAFRVKQDAVPGFTARTQFIARGKGRFEIACAELCGLGHYRMSGVLYVQDEAGYRKWLEGQVGWFE